MYITKNLGKFIIISQLSASSMSHLGTRGTEVCIAYITPLQL
jgi:hypothetical protein